MNNPTKSYNTTAVFIAACAGMAFFGVTMLSLAPILGKLNAVVGEGALSLPSTMSIGIILGTVIFGPVVDRFGYKWLLIWDLLLCAQTLMPHIEETSERKGIITVLKMICYIIGISKDQYIVISVFRPAGVDANDNLPVTIPVSPVHHDGNIMVNLVHNIFLKIFRMLKADSGPSMEIHIPSDEIKKISDVFY